MHFNSISYNNIALLCTFISCIHFSDGRPNAQVSGIGADPQAAQTSNTIADTNIFIGADIPPLPVDSGAASATAIFDPANMPTETGKVVVQTATAILQLAQNTSAQTASSNYTGSAGSALTSRDISADVQMHATTGSMVSHDGTTVYTVPVNTANLVPFLQAASAYAENNLNNLGGESNHDYFRFTSGNFTLAAYSYGACGTGDHPFNWYSFGMIAQNLQTLVPEGQAIDKTWVGWIQTVPDATRCVDWFLTPSFGDLDATNTTEAPSAATPAATSSVSTTDLSPNGPGGRRLAKRTGAVKVRIAPGFYMTINRAATTAMTGLLANVASNALTQVIADSGLAPTYQQISAAFYSPYEPELTKRFSNVVFQFMAEPGVRISKYVVKELLSYLIQLLDPQALNTNAQWPLLSGDLVYTGRTAKTIVARWSLGEALPQFGYCVIENPDASQAVGCFRRYFGP